MERSHGGHKILKMFSALSKLLLNCKNELFSWPHQKCTQERQKAQTSEYHRYKEVLNRYTNQLETCILALLS